MHEKTFRCLWLYAVDGGARLRRKLRRRTGFRQQRKCRRRFCELGQLSKLVGFDKFVQFLRFVTGTRGSRDRSLLPGQSGGDLYGVFGGGRFVSGSLQEPLSGDRGLRGRGRHRGLCDEGHGGRHKTVYQLRRLRRNDHGHVLVL